MSELVHERIGGYWTQSEKHQGEGYQHVGGRAEFPEVSLPSRCLVVVDRRKSNRIEWSRERV
jgi:hypothetical protein